MSIFTKSFFSKILFIKLFLAISLLLIAGCGGGSGGDDDLVFDDADLSSDTDDADTGNSDIADSDLSSEFLSLSGTYNGQSTQGEVFCSDGSTPTDGMGSDAGAVQFIISGANSFEEAGTLQFEDCTYSGRRFNASDIVFSSNESGCFDTIEFFALNGGDTIEYITRPGTPDSGPSGETVCMSTLFGEVSR